MNTGMGLAEHFGRKPLYQGQPAALPSVTFLPLATYRHGARPSGAAIAGAPVAVNEVSDDSDWIDLIEFTPALVNRIRKLKITTLGQLRGLSPARMISTFGRIKAIEIYRQLALAGFRLASNPSDEELWQFGFVDASELSRPTNSATSLAALRPWLGAATDALASNGISTLGELRAAAEEGSLLLFSGFTQLAIDRVLAFLAG